MNPIISVILLAAAIFFIMSGEIFFAFLFILLFAAALLSDAGSGKRARAPGPQPPGMLGQTEKKAFGGEKEIGMRFGYFFNFLGSIFGGFWNSFGTGPAPKKEEPKLVVKIEK